MTLIGRIVAEKRMAITVVLVTVVASVGLYVLAVYPLTIRTAQARQRQAASVQALATAEQSYQAARATMEGKSTTSDQLERFYGELLPPDLAGARGITYARLAELAGRHDLRMDRRSSTSEQEEASDLGRLRMTMLLAGEWADIRAFLAAVEDAPEFIVIQELVLSQSEEEGAALVLALDVSTYYRVERGA